MEAERTGGLRITGTRFELTVLSDDGRLIDIGLDIPPHTAHQLRHLAVAHVDRATGLRRQPSGRTMLERALATVGGYAEQIEVLPGDPPRFVLALITASGCMRRIDLDLLDTAELAVKNRLPVVAVGWPARDWDAALAQLRD